MAKGLDCGTSYYIAATDKSIKKQRNVFLTVDGDAKQVKRKKVNKKFVFIVFLLNRLTKQEKYHITKMYYIKLLKDMDTMLK